MSALIAYGDVDTVCLGIFHVLILAHPDGVIFRNQFAWCLLRGNSNQGNHVVHLIIIWGNSHGQMTDAVFRTHAEVVGMLGFQVLVA